jgi:hypothetical protein
VRTQPKLKKGKEETFMDGTDKERNLVLNILLKHSACIFEWLGRYGFFANHVAEIPSNGKVTKAPLFRMNKIRRDCMQEILDKYIERGIERHQHQHGTPKLFSSKSSMDQMKLWRPRDGA